jgi:hypothetical protein
MPLNLSDACVLDGGHASTAVAAQTHCDWGFLSPVGAARQYSAITTAAGCVPQGARKKEGLGKWLLS